MPKPTFKVGQKVRFIRDNTDGGQHYGRKGEIVEIRKLVNYPKHDPRINLIFDPPRHGAYIPYAHAKDLEPLTPEDPYVDTDF